jgi:hypothetical protein
MYAIKCSAIVSVLSPHSRTLFPSQAHSEKKWKYLKITLITIIVSRLDGGLQKDIRVRLVTPDGKFGSQEPYFERD